MKKGSIKLTCGICKENLDDRDLVEGCLIHCWKCGWKKELDLKDDEHDDLIDFYYEGCYFQSWD